jgi:hypothetical protein
VSFAIVFFTLYVKIKFANTLTVAVVWNNGQIKIPLFSGASLTLRQEKSAVIEILSTFPFTTQQDIVFWSFLSSSLFIVHSIYIFLNFRGVNSLTGSVWK